MPVLAHSSLAPGCAYVSVVVTIQRRAKRGSVLAPPTAQVPFDVIFKGSRVKCWDLHGRRGTRPPRSFDSSDGSTSVAGSARCSRWKDLLRITATTCRKCLLLITATCCTVLLPRRPSATYQRHGVHYQQLLLPISAAELLLLVTINYSCPVLAARRPSATYQQLLLGFLLVTSNYSCPLLAARQPSAA